MKVRECALLLQDVDLLRKLSSGDLIAQEAKYHKKCLVGLYNKKRAHTDISNKDNSGRVSEGIALAELLAYIEEEINAKDELTILRLADLVDLYKTRLEQLTGSNIRRVHSTELKARILSFNPQLQAYTEGRDVLIALYNLLVKSHDVYTTHTTNRLALQDWCDEQQKLHPQFKYWYVTLQLQMTIFIFIKSIRLRNVMLYKEALSKLMPCFFALDHPN